MTGKGPLVPDAKPSPTSEWPGVTDQHAGGFGSLFTRLGRSLIRQCRPVHAVGTLSHPIAPFDADVWIHSFVCLFIFFFSELDLVEAHRKQ